ncbi:serine-threonine protein kinase [Actinacidiphila acididurans]|uniref:Serine-threonine protein kinase n=1 Tax=Actinacidiphila acididurans TaxID=2784346 RepID=A0ABS2TS13_9ACTN|nr:serine-threonine protein kinase [Actinacidiphila acididurans]MBM9506119.1 serine-threonine protein kinase [Actinacidiphila acididurans]
MAVTVTSVRPHWDLTFDAGGDPDPRLRDTLLGAVSDRTDLVLFTHGWNNDVSTACELYDRFFAFFPALLAGAGDPRFGYAGVHWPSMRFSDEPIPDFPHTSSVPGPAGGLDAATRAGLARVFPGRLDTIDALAGLLERRPADPAELAEFAALVRKLTGAPPGDASGDDLGSAAGGEPEILTGRPVAVCRELADALQRAGADVAPEEADPELFGGIGRRVWDGAKELLRQATYYAMKRRAGTVGQAGLGPLLGAVARKAPHLRLHLVGHSFGARLVSYALAGLPPDVTVASVTLLQGAFSHYTFSGPLPFDAAGGALHGMAARVSGPLVACHSSHDQALGVLYPIASRLAGEDRSMLGLDDRWGAMGHDGFRSPAGTTALSLADALARPFPVRGCVSVDVSPVVCRGGPPAGAHSDICHEELARVVLRAGGHRAG